MGVWPECVFFFLLPSVVLQVTLCQKLGSQSAIPRLENEDGSLAGTLAFVGNIVRLRWTEDGA